MRKVRLLKSSLAWTGQQQQEEERGDREHTQGAELATEVGTRTLLDGAGD